MDDLSWWRVEDEAAGWDAANAIADTTRALFVEAGRTYVPFMVANAEALANGADEVVCEIDDVTFRQGAFGYQGKCVQWIRDAYTRWPLSTEIGSTRYWKAPAARCSSTRGPSERDEDAAVWMTTSG